jgi:hypothetical protein
MRANAMTTQSVKNAVYPGPADDNGNIVVEVDEKATCSARLLPGNVKLTLADVNACAE